MDCGLESIFCHMEPGTANRKKTTSFLCDLIMLRYYSFCSNTKKGSSDAFTLETFCFAPDTQLDYDEEE